MTVIEDWLSFMVRRRIARSGSAIQPERTSDMAGDLTSTGAAGILKS